MRNIKKGTNKNKVNGGKRMQMKKGNDRKKDKSKQIENKIMGEAIKAGFEEIIKSAAITIFAGYSWARYRNFDPVFNQRDFDADRRHAETVYAKIYKDKNTKEIIDEMINRQAEIIWWRRYLDGNDTGYSDYQSQQDRWEAKRYAAYLFFKELVEKCISKKICPEFNAAEIGSEIFDLLKSLTIEEYCKIKGYLCFLERREHGFDKEHYLSAMNDLDRAFLNCGNNAMKRMNSVIFDSIKTEDYDSITKAKCRPADRLGYIDREAAEEFVNKYYSFVETVISNDVNAGDAVDLLVDLYHGCHSKIINVLEFTLKCMIASYVDERLHSSIRGESCKQELTEIQKVINKQ